MRRLTVSGLAACLVWGAALQAQGPSPDTRAHVTYLASDRLEGRDTGSMGELLASEYISGQLARSGVRPLPGQSSLFLPFSFTGGTIKMYQNPTNGQYGSTEGYFGANLGNLIAEFNVLAGGGGLVDASGSMLANRTRLAYAVGQFAHAVH